MSNIKDLTGLRFGLLTVINRVENSAAGRARWLCRCDCGGEKTVASAELNRGRTRSCGCLALAQKRAAAQSKRHAYSRSSMTGEKRSWENMLARCQNKDHKSYPRYGGRGITVCARWLSSFVNFANDMGLRPAGCTLDRIDSNKNYTPENCRWATMIEQGNNRCDNRVIEFSGERLTVMQWSRRLNIRPDTIYQRLRRGCSVEMALSVAPLPRRNKTHK